MSKRRPVQAIRRLRERIAESRPDIVQTWMYHADLLGGIAARRAGVRRVIWGVHSTRVSVRRFPLTAALRLLCAALSHAVSSRILCVAEASRRAHERLGYAARRFAVIPNGFDVDRWTPNAEASAGLRRDWGVKEQPVIVSVGRFNPDKDHRNLVRAAAIVGTRRADARFVLVGHGLDERNSELRAWLHDAGCADRFILLGPRDDVRDILGAADVYCLHSRTEAAPVALGEAMCAGLPCVSTDVGDAATLVADTGWLVPREDPQRLAEALLHLLATPADERAEIGRRARQRMRDHYSQQVMVERIDRLYVEVLSGG